MDNWVKYIFPKYADKKVINDQSFRVVVAKQQAKLPTVDEKKIIEHCNNYLMSIGASPEAKVVDLKKNPIKRGFYSDILKNSKLADKRDIVWMKFTDDGYIGVVASSNDINFSMDTSSGRIIGFLSKKWDISKVIILPIHYEDGNHPRLSRQRVESGVGNYLISSGVPILDYFSHNL